MAVRWLVGQLLHDAPSQQVGATNFEAYSLRLVDLDRNWRIILLPEGREIFSHGIEREGEDFVEATS